MEETSNSKNPEWAVREMVASVFDFVADEIRSCIRNGESLEDLLATVVRLREQAERFDLPDDLIH